MHLHGCQKQGLKDLIFVSRLRQSVQGRATMAKTIQCADGPEKEKGYSFLIIWPFLFGIYIYIYQISGVRSQCDIYIF